QLGARELLREEVLRDADDGGRVCDVGVVAKTHVAGRGAGRGGRAVRGDRGAADRRGGVCAGGAGRDGAYGARGEQDLFVGTRLSGAVCDTERGHVDSSFGVERRRGPEQGGADSAGPRRQTASMCVSRGCLAQAPSLSSAQSTAGQLSEPVHPLSRPVSLGWIAPEIPASMKSGTCYTSAVAAAGAAAVSSACSGVPTMPAVSVAPSLSSMSRNEPVRRLSV